MMGFRARQTALLGAMLGALIVALAATDVLRGFLLPVAVGAPTYLNPIYILLIVLIGGTGLLTVYRTDDRGWPWLVGVAGLLALIAAFEDSILQWFTIQLGFGLVGGRVNPILITALLAMMGAAILLHAGQLARRLRRGLAERGIDRRELERLDQRTWGVAWSLVRRTVLLGAAASIVLFIGEFALGRARVGLGAVGILGGLVILAVLSSMAYRVLRTGPGVRSIDEEDLDVEQRPRKAPPRGLR